MSVRGGAVVPIRAAIAAAFISITAPPLAENANRHRSQGAADHTIKDVANPPELGSVERAMRAIHDGRYELIPHSDKTHGHLTRYYAAVWKPYLIDFMEPLVPAAARP